VRRVTIQDHAPCFPTIGNGRQLTRDETPSGTHRIEVTATTNDGRTDYADVTIRVEAT
jgi:hypothetical protein